MIPKSLKAASNKKLDTLETPKVQHPVVDKVERDRDIRELDELLEYRRFDVVNNCFSGRYKNGLEHWKSNILCLIVRRNFWRITKNYFFYKKKLWIRSKMKFLASIVLLVALCLIGVESVDINKFLFPKGFDAGKKLDRVKRK